MKIIPTELPEVLLIEPQVFLDARGFFMETYHARKLAEQGFTAEFVQDNHSRSQQGTLRGLHYQVRHAQGKLVRVVNGEIYRRGGGSAPPLAHVWPLDGRDFVRREQTAVVDSAGLCSRHSMR